MNIKLIIGIAAAAGLAYFFTTKQGKNVLSQVGIDVDDLYSQGEEALKNVTKRVAQKGQEITNNIHQPFNA
ncbi:MAG: YtxH domain-containing protein [Opitutaceae bacterium]|nr:YtxH domain-containing protein [Cytophagales bacterium]